MKQTENKKKSIRIKFKFIISLLFPYFNIYLISYNPVLKLTKK